jgi:hypothetical protein
MLVNERAMHVTSKNDAVWLDNKTILCSAIRFAVSPVGLAVFLRDGQQ